MIFGIKISPKRVGCFLLLSYAVVMILITLSLTHRLSITSQDSEAILQNRVNSIVPKTAIDVHFTERPTFQSTHFLLRFSLPSLNISNFIKDFCPNMEIEEGGYIKLTNDESIPWWKPEDASIYAVGSCVENNITIFNVLIDKTDPNLFLIYVFQ